MFYIHEFFKILVKYKKSLIFQKHKNNINIELSLKLFLKQNFKDITNEEQIVLKWCHKNILRQKILKNACGQTIFNVISFSKYIFYFLIQFLQLQQEQKINYDIEKHNIILSTELIDLLNQLKRINFDLNTHSYVLNFFILINELIEFDNNLIDN